MRIPRRLLAGAQLGRQQGHRRGALRHVVTRLGPEYPSAAACLAEDLPALVLHLRYPGRLRHRLRSTNLEHWLGEVKRRTRVIRRFTARAVSQPPLAVWTWSSPAPGDSVSPT